MAVSFFCGGLLHRSEPQSIAYEIFVKTRQEQQDKHKGFMGPEYHHLFYLDKDDRPPEFEVLGLLAHHSLRSPLTVLCCGRKRGRIPSTVRCLPQLLSPA